MNTIDITYKEIRELVYNKLITKTDNTPYEELSERIFGEGNCFNESEVRKRMYGMKRLIEIIEAEEKNGVATTILSVSDLHVPFQLDYTLLKDYRNKIDILQINGDVVDCQALSKFSKQYRISPIEEMIQGRQYLIDLITYINPSKVVCNYGNHDKRFANYFAKNLDTDILELLPDTSLELILIDGFKHYDKRSGAKIWYELQDSEKEPFDCVVMAHTHKCGDAKKGYIRLIEQGAFADIKKLDYANGRLMPPQKSGFAIICQDKDGNIIQDKSKVVVLD